MQQRYQDDQEFAFQLKKLLALAYVKPSDVIKYYDDIINSKYFQANEDFL